MDFRPDIAPAQEGQWAAGTDPMDPDAEVIPEDTEALIPFLRERFPEVTPRTSDPRVMDACIARAGIRDLIDWMEARLAADRLRRVEGE